jgi:hypothetical protein
MMMVAAGNEISHMVFNFLLKLLKYRQARKM